MTATVRQCSKWLMAPIARHKFLRPIQVTIRLQVPANRCRCTLQAQSGHLSAKQHGRKTLKALLANDDNRPPMLDS